MFGGQIQVPDVHSFTMSQAKKSRFRRVNFLCFKLFFAVTILKISSQLSKIITTIEKLLFCPQNRENDPKQRRGKHFIQISAVAKVVAKETLVQPISAWPCIRD